MKQIVLIPCWRRPEFLGACIEHIKKADGWEDNIYLFSIDRMSERANPVQGHSEEVYQIAKSFQGSECEAVYVMVREENQTNGNSYNLLEGYRDAVRIAKAQKIDLITMIETDIFIGKDFFRWHSMVHEQFEPFFASGCRNQNVPNFNDATSSDPADVFTHRSYQSLGVSWRPETLEKYVIPHACDLYYRNPEQYTKNRERFLIQTPNPWWEQDGLIYRVLLNENQFGIFPHVPRAYHAGFIGYNRKGKALEKSVPLAQRISMILGMSEAEMNARATRQEFKDITKCDLREYPEVGKLKMNGI